MLNKSENSVYQNSSSPCHLRKGFLTRLPKVLCDWMHFSIPDTTLLSRKLKIRQREKKHRKDKEREKEWKKENTESERGWSKRLTSRSSRAFQCGRCPGCLCWRESRAGMTVWSAGPRWCVCYPSSGTHNRLRTTHTKIFIYIGCAVKLYFYFFAAMLHM